MSLEFVVTEVVPNWFTNCQMNFLGGTKVPRILKLLGFLRETQQFEANQSARSKEVLADDVYACR